jgi:hypothetical protein
VRRSIGILLATVAASLSVAAAVYASGGTSIASAPELPLGKQLSSSVSRLDFWRITILAGDSLRITYKPVATDWVALCLMAPEVTDAGLSGANCLELHLAEREREYLRDFTSPGRYTLILARRSQGCVNEYLSSVQATCSDPASYEMSAFVVHRTTTSVSPVPRPVKRGAVVTVRGQVKGATVGNVTLQQRVGSRWTSKGRVPLRTGRFTAKVRATKTGTFRYRLFYAGDSSHRPSSAGFVLRVL